MFMIAGAYFHVPFAVVVDHPRCLCEQQYIIAHEQSIVTGISGIHLKSYIGGLQLPQTI